MKKRLPGLLSLLFSALLLSSYTPNLYGLGEPYMSGFRREIAYLIFKAPPYVWGRADDKGADCSGLIWWAARRAGMPVARTTAT